MPKYRKDLALSHNNLGLNLKFQGKDVETKPHYEKALDIRKRVLGEDHPETAQSYSNLASCLHRLARFA